jgi:carbohydrate kinase (thermoresistant glucokinase family)
MSVVVVMGVSGSGKTTIAATLAERMGWRLLEGDAYHPPENVAKMRAGTPLTDADRWPWLRTIAAEIDAARTSAQPLVVACSALKRAYRDVIIGDRSDVVLVHLAGSVDTIGTRLRDRAGHFMPPGLLDSQFATLEAPAADESPIVVAVTAPPDAIADRIIVELRKRMP